MAELGKFNPRNPAVKRILQEIKELQRENSPDMMAEALEDNIFEWHFAIRGPPDSEFAGGIYHGRLLMPPDYPFKPPAFMLLTPNGRFETGTKICLSISSHHPEHWQPSWSVRTALTALIAFLPSPGGGALGSLEFPKEERVRLAAKSRLEPPLFGSTERQAVTKSVHQKMLEAASSNPDQKEVTASRPAESIEAKPSAGQGGFPPAMVAAEGEPSVREAEASGLAATIVNQQALNQQALNQQAASAHESSWEDKGLGFLAAALSMAIIAILGRRLLIIAGVDISNFF